MLFVEYKRRKEWRRNKPNQLRCFFLILEDDCSILHVPAVLLNNTDVYVYWLSYKDSQIHGSKARFGSVIYLKNVHRILNQLENSTLNGWHCESTEDMRKKDPNLYLSCVVVLTLEEPLYL